MLLQYHGGPVQHVSREYAIFWAPPSYTFPVGYQQTVVQYLVDVAHDSYTPGNVYGTDTQYYDISRGVKRFASYAISFGAQSPTRMRCHQTDVRTTSCMTDRRAVRA